MPYPELRRLLRPFRTRLCLLGALITAQSAVAIAPVLVGQRLIDDGVLRQDTTMVWTLGAVLVGLGVLQAGLSIVETGATTRLAENVVLKLRTDMFAHLQQQSLGFFTAAKTGAIVSRLHGDVAHVQRVVSSTIPSAVTAVVLLLTSLGALVSMDWRLAAGALLLIPLLYAMSSRYTGPLSAVSREHLTAQAHLDSMAAERLSFNGVELTQLHGHQARDLTAFCARAARVRDVAVRGALVSAKLGASLTLMMSTITAAVYVTAGHLSISGRLSVGAVVALVALAARLYGPLAALPGIRTDLVTGQVALSRVLEILDHSPTVTDAPSARSLPARPPGVSPAIAFKDVHFTYPSGTQQALPSLADEHPGQDTADPVLSGLDFTVEPGTTVAIVGLSGAGKSTLARLLTRCWDTTAGQVLIDGVDVRQLRLRDVRNAIGLVTQDTFMLHDTIRTNLLVARPDAGTEDLIQACRSAQIWQVVAALPDGLDTLLGDRGVRLSGGQRQRLAIARLVLKDSPIVVLDEATSHSDVLTEGALLRSMEPFLRTRTCLIIAHRLSTIRNADQVLVIKDGRVIERGRHERLVQTGGWYAEMEGSRSGGKSR
ncbi:ABC transporter ATP-binding protein [Streptomyces alboflavus]|uniref:ABC transporter ATP-binding protein n=1 Tax=Streptomyces alboflavus TaxID=67267 RepID=UPI0036C18640